MTKNLLFAILAANSAISANAQTDITNQYLQNPSFELDNVAAMPVDATRGAYTASSIQGWTLTGSYGVSDIMTASATATDNNFGRPGTPSDGKQMYYIRHAWTATHAMLMQNITVPAGKYRLTVDNKCITASAHTAALIAGDESTMLGFQSSMPTKWNTSSVDFTVNKETTLSVGLNIDFCSGSGASILVDNFRLFDMNGVSEPETPTETTVTSPTEGIITHNFVGEAAMKADLMQMLANFSKYMVNDWFQCQSPNSIGESCGFFNGENSGGSNEQGVRPNADLSMICAFLVKYGKPAGIKLPNGVTWDKVEEMAMKSLVFAYSTHKANKLKVCAGGAYWGSTSTSDAVWESSLWAMSVAYSAYFQWDKLSEKQRGYIYAMLKAECNYELGRSIPTGYSGDTKAEENGWEADILAATLGLFPNDPLAPKWFARLREFAINSYSHASDAMNQTVIDPDYDGTTVADLYHGQNLYDDYTLQNHNLFHTSYQNVVMQELGEAALALKMFQMGLHGEEKWKTNALMHHNQEVQDNVLNWLALADGELAMPNGNDWSLFLYDQITSYTTQACFQRDANALMLENMAYKYIKARQATTVDGSWLLRADVGARRMGVEAHRVMMTYLMHDVCSTADMKATAWDDFNRKYGEARILPCQNVVRAATESRFTTFSWSNGLKSYTGYIAANNPDKNKIIVPYRANNTGNFLGWYEVSGKGTNATPVVSGVYQLMGNAFVMNGELNTNDAALNNRFAIYSTPGNAVIYLDEVKANAACTITAEKGGLTAISTDEMTKPVRTLYYNSNGGITHRHTDGATFIQMTGNWVNIDNEVSIVGLNEGKKIAFGDRANNNSIMTAKLYPMYSNTTRSVKAGDIVDNRNLIYYSNIKAEQTPQYAANSMALKPLLPKGWNGIIAADETCAYLLVSNFGGSANTIELKDVQYMGWAPVFHGDTHINDDKATTVLQVAQNNSYAQAVKVMVKGNGLKALLDGDDAAFVNAMTNTTVSVQIAGNGNTPAYLNNQSIKAGETIRVYLHGNQVYVENATWPEKAPQSDLTGVITNPNFDGNSTYGWNGTLPATNYMCAEHFNKTFDTNQTIKGLTPGYYELSVQGFYRAGSTDNAAKTHANGTEKLNAIVYANDSTMRLRSIMDEAGKNYRIGVETSQGYVPNSMEQTASYFRMNLYDNKLVCHVNEDGLLKIGIRKNTSISNDWTIFDNFRLKYLGKENPQDPSMGLRSISVAAPKDGNEYDITGRHIEAGKKGLHIYRGKKILKK